MILESAFDAFSELINASAAARDGGATLAKVTADRTTPERGVYFFLDPDEPGWRGYPRVVRVGTHALKSGSSSTLRTRLGQHRGTQGRRSGNHRGSIFRLLVGQALIAAGEVPPCSSWGLGNTRSHAAVKLGEAEAAIKAEEEPIEMRVSAYLARLRVVCVAVSDPPGPDSVRGIIERGSIALLSEAARHGLVTGTAAWLGRWSDRPAIKASSLWNQNHVGEAWSSSFLGQLRTALGG